MTSRSPEVSIVIVHYQVEAVLWRCLASLPDGTQGVTTEVIVVDNGSRARFSERLKERFPKAQYLASSENLGYGAGNNLGVKHAKGEFIFILNPDTELQAGAVTALITFLRLNPKVAIVAPTLIHPDGTPFAQQGALTLTPLRALAAHSIFHRLWPSNPISQKFWLAGVDQSQDRAVEVVPGSAFLVRSSVFKELGGFDPQFFLYFEEYDFCRRVLVAGHQIWMSGLARVTHLWEATTRGLPTQDISRLSLRLYLQKYYGRWPGLFWYSLTQISKYQFLLLGTSFLTLLAWYFLS